MWLLAFTLQCCSPDESVHRSVAALRSAAAAVLRDTLLELLNVYLQSDLYSLLSKLCPALHVRSIWYSVAYTINDITAPLSR